MKRFEIENALSEVQKKIKEREPVLNQKEIALNHAFENMEAIRTEPGGYIDARKNMAYMKSDKPPTVNIKEFAGVQELLKTLNDKYIEAATKAQNLSKTVMRMRQDHERDLREAERIKGILEKCGTLIQGPWKAAA